MKFSDEQIIDAVLKAKGIRSASRELNISAEAVSWRVNRMKTAGVNFPVFRVAANTKYTPERVRQLNAYIEGKKQPR